MRVEAEYGATAGKFDIAKRAKMLGFDAIHDTVHEMAKDEARYGEIDFTIPKFDEFLKRMKINDNLTKS